MSVFKYVIPLYSGIGNVIQSIPFMNEMKKRYGHVFGYFANPDFNVVSRLVDNILDKIYESISHIPSECKIAKIPERRSYPEYKSWFVDNDELLPDNFLMDGIGYHSNMRFSHKVVLWPECKSNWLCKRWPYFKELAALLNDVAIIGLDNSYKFNTGVADYRNKLSLLQTGGVLKNADIFIGNEGGMAHYAAALGVKTYVIMGCTDPVKCLPPNNVIAISKNLDCQPCHFNNMKIDGTTMTGCDDMKCLNRLTPEIILEFIK